MHPPIAIRGKREQGRLRIAGILTGMLCLLPASQLSAQPEIPTVKFDYYYIPFDRMCERLSETRIDSLWIEEMYMRADSSQTAWDADGPRLLRTIVEEIGMPFRDPYITATFTLCRIPSLSHPLLLSMRRYLRSATDGRPRPTFMFVGLVVHELLHIYLSQERRNQELMERYRDEPFSVKSHLFLMATLKMAYLKNGLDSELAAIIEKDRRIGGIYDRAWELVERDGYRQFVEALKR